MRQTQHLYRTQRSHMRRSQPEHPNIFTVAALFYGLYFSIAAVVRRLVTLGVLAFAATVIGTALYVHGVYGGDRDALLLYYLGALGIGLGYLAIKRPLVWLFRWRN